MPAGKHAPPAATDPSRFGARWVAAWLIAAALYFGLQLLPLVRADVLALLERGRP